jgi:septal ring factor EnvC (AmiA/AmiB activator)
MNAFRTVMPVVQRLLPLLEGNVLTAISNVLTPRPQAPPPQPKVDLAPLESSLTELQAQHRGLRDQVIEQNATLKRVEDQLEMVREATDRNTLEQQELLEDLKIFSGKVKLVAVIGIGVLVVGFVLNVLLFLHIQRVLP